MSSSPLPPSLFDVKNPLVGLKGFIPKSSPREFSGFPALEIVIFPAFLFATKISSPPKPSWLSEEKNNLPSSVTEGKSSFPGVFISGPRF